MLCAGIDVARALVAIGQECRPGRLRDAVRLARAQIGGGTTLAQALRATRAFPPFVEDMIDVAEEAGALDEIVQELADYYEWKLSMRRILIRGSAYPAIMLPIALVLLGVFLGVLDRALGGTSLAAFGRVIATVAGVAAILVIASLVFRGSMGRIIRGFPALGRIGRAAPVFGKLFTKLTLGNFAYALYLTTRAGVPIIQGLARAGAASGSATLELAAERAGKLVREGQTLRSALGATGAFPPIFLEVVDVGEESGRLEERLKHTSAQLHDEARFAAGVAATVSGVLLTLAVVAGIGASIVLAYLQLWQRMGIM